MTREKVNMRTECFIQGCHSKAGYSRKVKLLEQVDYAVAMELCSRHKNHFKREDVLLGMDLGAFGKEVLLGQSKDKDKLRVAKETLDYMQEQARTTNRERGIKLMIDAARHFVKVGDGMFLFGFYFGQLYAFSSFKDFWTDHSRQRRAQEIRNQMSLRELYRTREHPDSSKDLIDLCKCGHEWFMHNSGQPHGACYICFCPRYEFEQKLTRTEARDLHSLMYEELRKS